MQVSDSVYFVRGGSGSCPACVNVELYIVVCYIRPRYNGTRLFIEHTEPCIDAVGSPHNPNHDDLIKWKHIPRYWPFVLEIHRSR